MNPRFLNIETVSQYNDPQHFTRLFKKLTGQTPNEYKSLSL